MSNKADLFCQIADGTVVSRVQVWVSSVTEIRPEDLTANDLDSPPDKLHFTVTPPSNGHLALKIAPTKAVLNFTQAHIEQGQLLFVHKGTIPCLSLTVVKTLEMARKGGFLMEFI